MCSNLISAKLLVRLGGSMYIYVEHTKQNTIVYRVGPYRWSFTLLLFYLTELFEITLIPLCYRKIFHKGGKPTLLQWLARYPRLWSTKTLYPAETEIEMDDAYISTGLLGALCGRV